MIAPTVQSLSAELVVLRAQVAALTAALAALELQVTANTGRLDASAWLVPPRVRS